MWAPQKFVLLLLPFWVFGWHNRFQVFQENVTLSNINNKCLDAVAGVYKLNETTNALNAIFTFKIAPPESTMVYIKAFRLFRDDYRLQMLQLAKTLKSVTEMQRFGLETLCLEYIRPALIWPLEKGVTHRSVGWSPDSSKFPPNLSEGKWEVELLVAFANKTQIVVINWFNEIIYN